MDNAPGHSHPNVTAGGARRVVVQEVKKLDSATSSSIRKGQIITKVSDVVRELVENSVDSGATQVVVRLDQYGLDKIEVRDTGHGIPASDLTLATGGGYTSRLDNDQQHLSSHGHYGFRGEALSSICSAGQVWITTKTESDPTATKFKLNSGGKVISQTISAVHSTGTVVAVEKVFEKFPVRRKVASNNSRAELKEIQNFLKAVGIANPTIYMSLGHNGSNIWTKPSVPNSEQAIHSVLGTSISKSLQKCGPFLLENEAEDGETREIEAFFLKKPIDMRAMSFTNNSTTFFFVNRKRVVIREFEKILQGYTAVAITNPAPADRRRFPVAVVKITVPSDEVDFNRNIDKSTVFLIAKRELGAKLEEMLRDFYQIEPQAPNLEQLNSLNKSEDGSSLVSNIFALSLSPPLPDNPTRKLNIMSFMENITVTSPDNFSRSPIKAHPIQVAQEKQDALSDVPDGTANITAADQSLTCSSRGSSTHNFSTSAITTAVSNFDINMDDIFSDDTPPGTQVVIDIGSSKEIEIAQDTNKQVPEEVQIINPMEANVSKSSVNIGGGVIDVKQWILGRITTATGNTLRGVDIQQPPSLLPTSIAPSENSNQTETLRLGVNSVSAQQPGPICPAPVPVINAFDHMRSGLERDIDPIAPKRIKLDEQSRRLSGVQSERTMGISFTVPRQVTFDPIISFKKADSQQYGPMVGSSSMLFQSPLKSSTSMLPSTKIARQSSLKSFITTTPRGKTAGSGSLQGNAQMSLRLEGRESNGNRCGELLGSLTDPSLFPAVINDVVGIFCPMNMLQEFSHLKYDMNISFTKTSGEKGFLNAEYTVSKEEARRLLKEFTFFINPTCDNYPKIFHKLTTFDNLHATSPSHQSHRHGGKPESSLKPS